VIDLDALLAEVEGSTMLDALLAQTQSSDPEPPYRLRHQPDVGVYRLRLGASARHALTCLVVAGIVEGDRPLVSMLCGCFGACPTSERERQKFVERANEIGVLSLKRIEGSSDADLLLVADLVEPLRADARAALQRTPRVYPRYRAVAEHLDALLQAISASGLRRQYGGSRAIDLDALLAQVQQPSLSSSGLELDALLQAVEERQHAIRASVSLQRFDGLARKAIAQRQLLNGEIDALYQAFQASSDPYPIWTRMIALSQRSQALVEAYRSRRTKEMPDAGLFWQATPSSSVRAVARQTREAWKGRSGWFLSGLTPEQSVVLAQVFWDAFRRMPEATLRATVSDPGAHRDKVREKLGRSLGISGGRSTPFHRIWLDYTGGQNPRVAIGSRGAMVTIGTADLVKLALAWLQAEAEARGLIRRR